MPIRVTGEVISEADIAPAMASALADPTLTESLTAKLVSSRRKKISEHYRKNTDRFYAPETVLVAHLVRNADERTGEVTARPRILKSRSLLAASSLPE